MRGWLVVIGIIILCIVGYFSLGFVKSHGKSDFAVYYATARVVTGQTKLVPGDIYHQQLFRPTVRKVYQYGGTYFLYPPQAAILFTPLVILTFHDAVNWWQLMNVVLFFVATVIWLFVLKQQGWRQAWWLGIFAVTPPIISIVDTGQINMVVYLLFALAWLSLYLRRFSWLIGVSLAVATVVKIFPIIFLPYLLIKRQFKAALSFIITLLVLTAVSLPVFGVTGWKVFLTDRLPDVLAGNIGYAENSVSLYGSLRTAILASTYDWLGDKPKDIIAVTDIPYKILTIISFGLLCIYLFRTRQRQSMNQYLVDYSLILLFIILISEIVHQHYLVWLAPTAIWLWQSIQMQQWWLKCSFIISVILVFFQKLLPILSVTDSIIKPVTVGLLLLAGCLVYTVWRSGPSLESD